MRERERRRNASARNTVKPQRWTITTAFLREIMANLYFEESC
jgi:hypothetical protein